MTGTFKTVHIDLSSDIADEAQRLLERNGMSLEDAISRFIYSISRQEKLPTFLVEAQIFAHNETNISTRIEEVRQKLNERDGPNTWKEGSETALKGRLGDLCRDVHL